MSTHKETVTRVEQAQQALDILNRLEEQVEGKEAEEKLAQARRHLSDATNTLDTRPYFRSNLRSGVGILASIAMRLNNDDLAEAALEIIPEED